MCDIVLEKPINCSGSSWEAMWAPLCTSSSQMWLFPQCQIPWILAAEWVQNLTWSETCAYKNLLPLNSWCILGALMCEVPLERAGWQQLWASLAHTRTHPSLPQTPSWLFPCAVGRGRVRLRGASTLMQQLSSVNPGAGPGGAEPPRLLSQGKSCEWGSSWGQELTCWELQPEQRWTENKGGHKHQVSWPSSWHCCSRVLLRTSTQIAPTSIACFTRPIKSSKVWWATGTFGCLCHCNPILWHQRKWSPQGCIYLRITKWFRLERTIKTM